MNRPISLVFCGTNLIVGIPWHDLFLPHFSWARHADEAHPPPSCALWPEAVADVPARGSWERFPDPARLAGLRIRAKRCEDSTGSFWLPFDFFGRQ